MLNFYLQDDIAVHTWTHPYMTTLSNLDLLGQFGWTMEIIHNSTGGRLPRFWRPPYGDADNRVVAIAKEVFGLTTIVWNQEYASNRLFLIIPLAYFPYPIQHGGLEHSFGWYYERRCTGVDDQVAYRSQVPWFDHPRARAVQPDRPSVHERLPSHPF